MVKKQDKEKKLTYDVFAHELAPKHILLSAEEAREVLGKYHIRPFQLPYIKVSDPAARTIGAKPGDLVRIIRKSQTAGESDFYRYVVEEF